MKAGRGVREDGAGRRSATPSAALEVARGHRHRKPLAELTNREIEVVDGLMRGLTNKQIGEELGISHRTVEIHRSRLMRKLGTTTLAGVLAIVLPQRALVDARIAENRRASPGR